VKPAAKRFALPFCVALAAHAALLLLLPLPGLGNRDAQIVLQRGATAVLLDLAPSRAAEPRRTPDTSRMPDVPEPTEKPRPPEIINECRLPDEKPFEEPPELARPAQRPRPRDPVDELADPATLRYRREPAPAPRESKEVRGDLARKGVDTPARTAGLTRPKYPWISRLRGEEGTVVLSVEVRADGSCGRVRMVTSSGHRRLDRAALESLKRAKFIPAVRRGRPMTQTKDFKFVFRLKDAR